jgi:hypothetical protein
VLLFSHVITLFLFPQLFFRSALTPFFVVVQRLNRLLGSLIMLSFSDYIAFFFGKPFHCLAERRRRTRGKELCLLCSILSLIGKETHTFTTTWQENIIFLLENFCWWKIPERGGFPLTAL